MKLSSLKIASLFGALSLAAAGSASAIVVGGVDLGNTGTHLETTTIAETFINGNGQQLLAYGQVNTVNGNLNYTTNAGERLYFVVSNYTSQNYSSSSVNFAGGVINVYRGADINLLLQSSPTNITTIQSYAPWVTLSAHGLLSATGQLTGTTLSFTGAGLLDATSGVAFAALNGNSIPDGAGGFADIAFTTSGNNFVLNAADVLAGLTAGCSTGNAAPGAWCFQGSADLRGSVVVVPEPASLALIGLVMLGVGSLRKRKAA